MFIRLVIIFIDPLKSFLGAKVGNPLEELHRLSRPKGQRIFKRIFPDFTHSGYRTWCNSPGSRIGKSCKGERRGLGKITLLIDIGKVVS